MRGIEGAFDGEQGRVGEGDDERLGRGVDVVGCGIRVPKPAFTEGGHSRAIREILLVS